MNHCARIENLSVAFGGHSVLKDISLHCPDGAATVLLGHSGSGKTTLLRSLNRLNEHFPRCETTGSIELKIGGQMRPILGDMALPTLRRKAAMVFQSPNPLPLSVERNIALPLQLLLGLKGSEAQGRIEEALRSVGLWDEVKDRLKAPASQLSGGQQQRLCLARTLALEPDLLLLDEPTASLDPKAGAVIEDLIISLKGRYPMVIVSHNLHQAMKIADKIAILRDGCLTSSFMASEVPAGHEGVMYLEGLLASPSAL